MLQPYNGHHQWDGNMLYCVLHKLYGYGNVVRQHYSYGNTGRQPFTCSGLVSGTSRRHNLLLSMSM